MWCSHSVQFLIIWLFFWFVLLLCWFVGVQLAVQLAVIISKVARIDLPGAWPELLPRLVEVRKRPTFVIAEIFRMLAFANF